MSFNIQQALDLISNTQQKAKLGQLLKNPDAQAYVEAKFQNTSGKKNPTKSKKYILEYLLHNTEACLTKFREQKTEKPQQEQEVTEQTKTELHAEDDKFPAISEVLEDLRTASHFDKRTALKKLENEFIIVANNLTKTAAGEEKDKLIENIINQIKKLKDHSVITNSGKPANKFRKAMYNLLEALSQSEEGGFGKRALEILLSRANFDRYANPKEINTAMKQANQEHTKV